MLLLKIVKLELYLKYCDCCILWCETTSCPSQRRWWWLLSLHCACSYLGFCLRMAWSISRCMTHDMPLSLSERTKC